MKTLLLVRHAKSDWGNPALSDFERPLNDRGKRDAPDMAKRVHDRKIKIDQFISSPAKRAAKTAKEFAEVYDKKKGDILFIESLYHAQIPAFLSAISNADKKADTIAVFSHNYGITDFANTLTDTRIDNIPTCGVFAVQADCKNWKDFEQSEKQFLFFDCPKGKDGQSTEE